MRCCRSAQHRAWMAVSEAFHLITAGLVKWEGGDLRDLCALDNSSINALPGANSHLYWSRVERLGLRTLNCCVSSWFAHL